MLRSAAKNYNDVAVITDPADYDRVIEAMKSGAIPAEVKMELAWKVFEHTAHYDALIAGYFREKTSQNRLNPNHDMGKSTRPSIR